MVRRFGRVAILLFVRESSPLDSAGMDETLGSGGGTGGPLIESAHTCRAGDGVLRFLSPWQWGVENIFQIRRHADGLQHLLNI